MIYEKNKISSLEVTRLKYFLDLARGIYYFNRDFRNYEIGNQSLTLPNIIVKKQTDNDIYSVIFCIDSVLDIIKKIHAKVKTSYTNLHLLDITIGRHKTFIHEYGTKKSTKSLQKDEQQNSSLINYSSNFCVIPLSNEIFYYSTDLVKSKAFSASAGDFLFFENESFYFGKSNNPITLNLVYSTISNTIAGTRLLKNKGSNTKNTNLSLHNNVQNAPIDITLHRIQDIINKIEE